jgi:hypothetical protein
MANAQIQVTAQTVLDILNERQAAYRSQDNIQDQATVDEYTAKRADAQKVHDAAVTAAADALADTSSGIDKAQTIDLNSAKVARAKRDAEITGAVGFINSGTSAPYTVSYDDLT